MTPFGNILYKKQGESLFQVIYRWKNGTFMTAQVFMKTEAGAIAKTYPLALACGFGVDPDTHEVTKHDDIDSLGGHTVETNAILRLKSNRILKADGKREALEEIQAQLKDGLCLPQDTIGKLGRIIR